MKTPHTVCPRGQRVRVQFLDGSFHYGRFKERTPKWVVLDNRKIRPGDIRAFTIVKGGRTMLKLLDIYQAGAIRPGALEFLYELMKEREPEINISHRELPSFEQHRQFVTRRPYRFWYLIERAAEGREEPVWIGYVSATHANEIGIVLRKAYRGNGFGPAAIRQLVALHRPNPPEPGVRSGRWLANIAPMNEHSRHVFEKKLGFRRIQETYQLEEEHHGHEEAAARSA